jgi:hypothetical protein
MSSPGFESQTTRVKVEIVVNNDQIAQIRAAQPQVIDQLPDSYPASVYESLRLGQNQRLASDQPGGS